MPTVAPSTSTLSVESVKSEAAAPWSWSILFPFTPLGAPLVLFVGYLLLGPARTQVDIVAATLGLSLTALLILLLLGTYAQGVRLRRIVTLQMNRELAAERFESESPVTLVFKLPRFSIAPFFC